MMMMSLPHSHLNRRIGYPGVFLPVGIPARLHCPVVPSVGPQLGVSACGYLTLPGISQKANPAQKCTTQPSVRMK